MFYRAYGVTLESTVPLPELETASGPDVDVFTLSIGYEPPPAGASIVYGHTNLHASAFSCARCEGGYLQTFDATWRFFLSVDGRRIVAYEPLPAPATLSHLVLDSVLPHALNLAARDALHATAVLTPRGVVAFTGLSGAGKSTLAARFITRGAMLVSDDCLVLALDGDAVRTAPSYSGLRLLPDGIAWMALDVDATTPVADYGTKRRIVRDGTVSPTGGLLTAVYVLTAQPEALVAIEPLTKREAFSRLLEASFRVDTEDRVMMRRQFDLFAAVVERVPVNRLRIPRSLDAVDEACAAVRADVGF